MEWNKLSLNYFLKISNIKRDFYIFLFVDLGLIIFFRLVLRGLNILGFGFVRSAKCGKKKELNPNRAVACASNISISFELERTLII